MFLGAYHFEGDSDALVAAYRRMMAGFSSEDLSLHIAVRGPGALIVFDACPDAATFRSFSTSADFRDAVATAGLPVPRIEELGEVESAVMNESAAKG